LKKLKIYAWFIIANSMKFPLLKIILVFIWRFNLYWKRRGQRVCRELCPFDANLVLILCQRRLETFSGKTVRMTTESVHLLAYKWRSYRNDKSNSVDSIFMLQILFTSNLMFIDLVFKIRYAIAFLAA